MAKVSENTRYQRARRARLRAEREKHLAPFCLECMADITSQGWNKAKAENLCSKCYRADYWKRYYASNREKILAKNKQWRKDNPERSRRISERSDLKRKENGKRRAYERRYYAENRDRILASRRECRE